MQFNAEYILTYNCLSYMIHPSIYQYTMFINTIIFLPQLLFLRLKPKIHFVNYTYMSNQKNHFLHNAMIINLSFC